MHGHLEHIDTNLLREYHHNPRKGNPQLIAQSLTTNGQYKPLIVNTGTQTGRPYEVLAGNHTLKAMQHLNHTNPTNPPHPTTIAYIIDVDDEQAARIVAADNKTSDDSTYNTEALTDLLHDLPNLDGTGYTPNELETLLTQLDTQVDTEEEDEELTNPYDDFIPLHLNLAPPLMTQWLNHAQDFDSGEEALEHLLDHHH